MNEKPKVIRSLEPRIGAPREADELRRVTEITRDIEELGRAIESRDHPTRHGTAKKTKGLAPQAGQSAGQELEQQLAARADDEKLLAQERARRQELEQQLADRWDATLDRGRSLTVTLSNRPTSIPTAPDAPGSLEAARLMEEARLLLDQGNVGTARSVLQRAAESGSATALLLLAETYDREMLAAWGILGRHGNVRKARELYTKAVAGGVREAKYRLSALREEEWRKI